MIIFFNSCLVLPIGIKKKIIMSNIENDQICHKNVGNVSVSSDLDAWVILASCGILYIFSQSHCFETVLSKSKNRYNWLWFEV